jgi:hypothetical protein
MKAELSSRLPLTASSRGTSGDRFIALYGGGRCQPALQPVRKPSARSIENVSQQATPTVRETSGTLRLARVFDGLETSLVGVSHEGRIFASAPAVQSGDRLVEVNAQTGAVTPYPDQAWNTSGTDTEHEWAVPQAMWVDKADHLWVREKLPG